MVTLLRYLFIYSKKRSLEKNIVSASPSSLRHPLVTPHLLTIYPNHQVLLREPALLEQALQRFLFSLKKLPLLIGRGKKLESG